VLSFLVEVGDDGVIAGFEITPSRIRIERRLTYEQTDTLIALGGGAARLDEAPASFVPPVVGEDEKRALPADLPSGLGADLARAARVARSLLERRAEAGALILKGPDVDVKVRDGVIRIRRFEPWTPAWVLVSEAMILANRLAAGWLGERGIPAIYRRQPPPDQKVAVGRTYEPAVAAAARRTLKRTEIGLTPGPHAGLGLPAYVQVTSPLRRYQDLACHRQIRAALRGEPPPFDAEALWRVAATTDEAERTARDVERGTREYWILRYLESQPHDRAYEATITRAEERRTLVELTELVYLATLVPRPGHKPGRKIQVVVEAVNPRGGRLVVREVGG
jgi:exoribonuclease-2